MRWIKASERLPEKPGYENKVIVRGADYVTYGFKNFDDANPAIYVHIGSKTFLTLDVEWLDESLPASIEQEAETLYPYAETNIGLPNATCNSIMDCQRSAHITAARQYMGEIEKGREAIDILKALCALKKHKDTVGKDQYYEAAQPEVWKIANKFLENLNKK